MSFDFDFPFPKNLAATLDVIDLVFLEEKFDALGQAVNRFGFLSHHLLEINFQLAGLDAHAFKLVLRCCVEFGSMQKRLGRDTSDIQAGAAQHATILDAHGLQAELSGTNCAIVAAGAATDNDDVVCLSHGEICLA